MSWPLWFISAVIGYATTLALLWPYGAFTALLGMSFGGSALVLAVGILMALLEKVRQATKSETTQDQMGTVAAGDDCIP